MSRIGRLPIALAGGVQVKVADGVVTVQGPKGTLTQPLADGISAELQDDRLLLKRKDDSKRQKALHGLMRALLANAVSGVAKGFTRELEIQGVGYRAQLSGGNVTFNLGYTHPVDFAVPKGIQITVDKQTKVTVSGIDRQQVGQVAAEIRALRKPDPYKQKGIRYMGEVLKKKAGKAGATGAK